LKRIFLIFAIFFFYSTIFALQDTSNAITEFSAKLKKGNIYLQWVIRSLPEFSKIRIEVKNTDEGVYQSLDEINTENYSRKSRKDSSVYLSYNYTYKPYKNGVYFFKVSLTDKSYRIKFSDEIKIGVSEIAESKLYQNTPNPFNPTTSISYELFSATKVMLKIYSLDGKEIETLIDDFQGPGTYKIEFNAGKHTELSSGIYFYKLQTDRSSDIKKMIFTK
jgi:hypothetical protein